MSAAAELAIYAWDQLSEPRRHRGLGVAIQGHGRLHHVNRVTEGAVVRLQHRLAELRERRRHQHGNVQRIDRDDPPRRARPRDVHVHQPVHPATRGPDDPQDHAGRRRAVQLRRNPGRGRREPDGDGDDDAAERPGRRRALAGRPAARHLPDRRTPTRYDKGRLDSRQRDLQQRDALDHPVVRGNDHLRSAGDVPVRELVHACRVDLDRQGHRRRRRNGRLRRSASPGEPLAVPPKRHDHGTGHAGLRQAAYAGRRHPPSPARLLSHPREGAGEHTGRRLATRVGRVQSAASGVRSGGHRGHADGRQSTCAMHLHRPVHAHASARAGA